LARKSLQTYDLAEGRTALAAVEKAIGPNGDTVEHAELYSHKANFVEIEGDPQCALELLDKSCKIRGAHGDSRGLALLEKLSGNIHLRLKDHAGARKCYEAALGLLSDDLDSKDALEALIGVARCDLNDGRAEAAEARLKEALARSRACSYAAGVSWALLTLATALEKLGRMDEALRAGREASQVAKSLDPALVSAAAMLVWRLENVTGSAVTSGGYGRQTGA
jgi:tetratricopeptide (TPR) repeat protein